MTPDRPFARAALAAILALAACACAKAEGGKLRWSHQADAATLDPMASDDAFTLGFQGWFYEALTGYDRDLKLVPMLAERWENPEPAKWIFHLREQVSFHDGSPFTADDVVFSWRRSLTPGSAMKKYGAKAAEVNKIDDHTIEVITPAPNPILPRDWASLYIMSERWALRHQAAQAGGHAALHENGTGPFRVVERRPGARTVFERYEAYWDGDMPGNVAGAVFQPIADAAERVAALIAGDMDIVMPVPPREAARLKDQSHVRLVNGAEARVVFVGMDQHSGELPHSSVKGKNPFKDKRVRTAASLAMDLEDIGRRTAGGAARPAGMLIANQVNGYDASLEAPPRGNPEQSRKLLADAGYPDGFSVRLACPDSLDAGGRGVCRTVSDMLARAGIHAEPAAWADAAHIAGGAPPARPDAGMYLWNWTPRSMDAAEALAALVSCRDAASGAGRLNLGGYCNKEIDALTVRIEVETDQARRTAMIKEAFAMLRNDHGYLPLFQPPMSWGARTGIRLEQRPDNVLDIRGVVMPPGGAQAAAPATP